MPHARQPGRFSHIETYEPVRRSLVATPQFWIYVLAGLFLVVVVLSQFGFVRNRSEQPSHPDLNATERPTPSVPDEGRRSRTAAPVTQPAPIENMPAGTTEQDGSRMARTDARPVREFVPPTPEEKPAPKPAMPHAAEAPAVVVDHASEPAVKPPVDHTPEVKVTPPPASPAAAKPDTTEPATDSTSTSTPPPQQ